MAKENADLRSSKVVVLLGANRISSSIAHALAHGGYDVYIVAQTKESSSPTPHTTYHHSDLSPTSFRPLLESLNPDLLISTTSGGNFDLQTSIIDTAISAGVPRFIPAEFSHDTSNPEICERLPPHKERERVIDRLRSLASEGRIEWCGIATGVLLDYGLLSGDLGLELKWQSATIHGDGAQDFPASSVDWIGKAVVAAAEHWEVVRNQYIYLNGLVTSGDEVVSTLEKATGQTWEVGRVDVEDTLREAEQRIKRGFPDAGMFLVGRSVLYDPDVNAVGAFLRSEDKRKLGLEDESLGELVEGVVHQYRHHGKADCGCG
ncbi:hypothetical protein B0A48_16942 [Cryoendolithus antarcticus]|uniref:NmrA-like domain-containing protein n=1 Tax=Cryoendolithus antarcticus TaxID=1507870 RepID=A0A1V8SCR4_9PEZI|nr:hypothetical protein B0A48_16942 [Cryoendolithus antarcticus]